MAATITGTPRKSRGYLILDEKLKKKKIQKGKQRHYFQTWKELTKHPISKQTEAIIYKLS